MKKLLLIVLVFSVCLLIAHPGRSNPTPENVARISHLFFYADGSFTLELLFAERGEENSFILTNGSGWFPIDITDVGMGDYFTINSSAYPGLTLDPTDDYLEFQYLWFFDDDGYFTIGMDNCDVKPIPLGCGITDMNTEEIYGYSDFVYDNQLNLRHEKPVAKGVVKATVKNLLDEPLPGFLVGVSNNVEDKTFVSSEDGFYYLDIYWDATIETTFYLSNYNDIIDYNYHIGTPLDTVFTTFIYEIPSMIDFSGTVELENQTNHIGSYVYLEPYNSDYEITYHLIDNATGEFNLEIPSGIYRAAYLHDHYAPKLTGDFLPYTGSKNVYKFLQADDKVVNLVSPLRNQPLIDSTYYLFSDLFIPVNNTLEIYDEATVVLPLPKEITVEGTVNISGESNNPISFISDYTHSPFCLFHINEESGSVFANHCDYEDFMKVFDVCNGTLEVSNTSFINSEQILSCKSDANAYIINCSLEGYNPDSVVMILRDSSYVEIDNCTFSFRRVFDVFDHAYIRLDSCFLISCDNSTVWDFGFYNANYSVFDDAAIRLNKFAQARVNHSTLINGSGLSFWLYGDYVGNYPDTTLLIQNSVCYNNFRHVNGPYESNGYVQYNQFYPYERTIYFQNSPNIGTLTTVNYNNDSCDIYHNIIMDPLLKDDLHLTWDSPCINAGDPNSPKDPDSTITDMGAYFYDLTALIEEVKRENPVSVTSYPNPATEVVTFDISHQQGVSGTAIITLYNLNGVPVATNYQELPPSESITRSTMPLHNRGLATGVYVYTIEIPGQETVGGKLTVVK